MAVAAANTVEAADVTEATALWASESAEAVKLISAELSS